MDYADYEALQEQARQLPRVEAERDRLARQVQRMRDWADKMEAEAPKPAPGGFFADEVRRVLDGGQS